MSFLFINKTLRLNNLKIRIAMNAKISVFVIRVEAIIYLLLYDLHDCIFKYLDFQKVPIQYQLLVNQFSRFEWKFRCLKWFFYSFYKGCNQYFGSNEEFLKYSYQSSDWHSYCTILARKFFLQEELSLITWILCLLLS